MYTEYHGRKHATLHVCPIVHEYRIFWPCWWFCPYTSHTNASVPVLFTRKQHQLWPWQCMHFSTNPNKHRLPT